MVSDKATRVANFQKATIENLVELLAAAGLDRLDQLEPKHINHRIQGTNIKNYAQMYPTIASESLLHDSTIPADWRDDWDAADPARW